MFRTLNRRGCTRFSRDSTAIKSEGTRMFVNVIRTLWHADTPDGEQRKTTMGVVSSVRRTLARATRWAQQDPILINEGIIASPSSVCTLVRDGAFLFFSICDLIQMRSLSALFIPFQRMSCFMQSRSRYR
jgi:hypothetical protein